MCLSTSTYVSTVVVFPHIYQRTPLIHASVVTHSDVCSLPVPSDSRIIGFISPERGRERSNSNFWSGGSNNQACRSHVSQTLLCILKFSLCDRDFFFCCRCCFSLLVMLKYKGVVRVSTPYPLQIPLGGSTRPEVGTGTYVRE